MKNAFMTFLIVFLVASPVFGGHGGHEKTHMEGADGNAVADTCRSDMSDCDSEDIQGCCSFALMNCASDANTHLGWTHFTQTLSRTVYSIASNDGRRLRFHETDTPPPRV